MPPIKEKRFHRRTNATTPVVYFPFTSYPSDRCSATALNASEYGLCMESPKPLKPGQCICIRTTRFVKGTDGLRNFSLAQVRWCLEREQQLKVNYTIGVSYV